MGAPLLLPHAPHLPAEPQVSAPTLSKVPSPCGTMLLHPRCLPSSTPRGDAPSWGSPRAQLNTPTTQRVSSTVERQQKNLEIRNPEAFPSAKPQPLQEAGPGDKKGLSTGEPRRETARAPITGSTTGPHTGVGTSWPSCGGLVPPGTGRSSEG